MQDQVEALRQLGVRAAFLNSSLDAGEAGRDRAAAARRRTRPAVRRARTPADAALPVAARPHARSRCSPSTRRTACRNGATISGPEYRAAHRAARALAAGAAHRAYRDRRCADAARDRRAPRAGGRASSSSAPSTAPNIRYTVVQKDDSRRQLLDFLDGRAGQSGIVYCLSRRKVDATAAALVERGHRCPALPRRPGRARARRQPAPLPARGRRRHGGDDRVRHGHRQAGRALRRAHGPAEIARGLLPGNRPRRSRRRAGRGVAGLRPGRRGAAAADDRELRVRRGAQAAGAQQARRADRLSANPPAAGGRRCSATSAKRIPAPAAIATTAWTRRRAGTAPSPRRRRCRASTAAASASAPRT